MGQSLSTTRNNLQANGFQSAIYQTGSDAAQAILQQITPGSSVGIGGSITIQTLGLSARLRELGCSVHWHWESDNPVAARNAAFDADYYLLSANALDEDGIIYNIDGTGNRVAATLFGRTKVIMVVGRNKLVKGHEAAIERIKQVCCPQNARRLGLSTPCAITGHCNNCHSPQRMCAGTVILARKPGAKPDFSVMLVDEDLGY